MKLTPKSFGLSGSALKVIAIITMFIDHIGAVLIMRFILNLGTNTQNIILANPTLYNWQKLNIVFRGIGRISFPIFCFLLVEGFLHTGNRVKYAFRLLIFCFISEIPFDLASSGTIYNPMHQNIFFTLFISFLLLMCIEKFYMNPFVVPVIILAGATISQFLFFDYGYWGVIFIVLLYLLRDREWLRFVVCALCLAPSPTGILAFIPISLYNNKPGKLTKYKYLFYIFYPAHLLILYAIGILFLH